MLRWHFASHSLPIAAQTAENMLTVRNAEQLRAALREAKPGTHIRVAPGEYQGGIYLQNVQGAAEKPIVIGGAMRKIRPFSKAAMPGCNWPKRRTLNCTI